MRKMIMAAACGIVFGTGLAAAQQAPAIHEGHLDQIDTNKDGGVSRAEYQAFMTAAFAKLDANGDGFLGQNELSQITTAAQFASMDANGDGRVSRDEFMNQVMADFATADRGGDGHLR